MDVQPYADYKYYTDEYMGTSIQLNEFPRYARWASCLIDRITSGRVRKLEDVPVCVKDAMCAAAETCFHQNQKAGRIKKSENNDGYSVSYADAEKEDDMIQRAASDIRTYLAGTGLIYRGRLHHDYECRYHDPEPKA